MRDGKKKVSIVLFGAAIAITAISVYCFWNAHRITEQLWEMANEEPSAALLLMDKADPEIITIAPRDLIRLNDYRSKSKKVGLILMVLSITLLISSLTLGTWSKRHRRVEARGKEIGREATKE